LDEHVSFQYAVLLKKLSIDPNWLVINSFHAIVGKNPQQPADLQYNFLYSGFEIHISENPGAATTHAKLA